MKKKLSALFLSACMLAAVLPPGLTAAAAEYEKNTAPVYPVVKQSYDYALTFSGVQGGYNWRYLNAPIGADAYEQMPVYLQTDAYGSGGWKKSAFNWEYGIITPNYISSGSTRDPVLAFQAPVSGTISIDMVGGLVDKRTGGDGLRMNIIKESGATKTKLFPTGEAEFFEVPFELNQTVVTPFDTISGVEVQKGDSIYIRVNKGAGDATNSNDNLYITPKITYTSDVGLYLEKDYMMLNLADGVGESREIPYQGTGSGLTWASSDPGVASVSQDGRVTAVGAGSAEITVTAQSQGQERVCKTQVDVVNQIMPEPFADGDVVGVWGDSITHAGLYGHDITAFYAAKYPERKIDLAEFGYSGDNTQDILSRVERDCETRPDLNKATVMIGANDVAIENTQENSYFDRLTQIIRKLKAKGITDITIFTPSPYDGIRSGNMARAKQIEEFSYDARRAASEEGCAIVDIWTEMMRFDTILKEGYEVSPDMPTIVGEDNLHPRDLGHMVITRLFLQEQGVWPLGADKALPKLSYNAASGAFDRSEHCTISGLTTGSNIISFDYTANALPFPMIEGYKQLSKLVNLSEELQNDDFFQVTGLADGNYEVTINGVGMGTVSAKQLAQGMNLAAEENSPVQNYAKKLQTQIDAIHTLDFFLITNILTIETKYLGLSAAVSEEAGIQAANDKEITASWTASMRDAYVSAKQQETSKREQLAAAWEQLYSIARNRTFSVRIAPKSEVKTHYDAAADMSGVQGENCWYYMYSPVGKFTLADYAQYLFYGQKYWMAGEGDFKYGRIRNNGADNDQAPGNLGDSARVFQAPASGKIKISIDEIRELSSSDISRFRIYQNDTVVYPEDGSWLVLKAGDSEPFGSMTLDVAEGDRIIFRVNKGSDLAANTEAKNDGDKVVYLPVIDYLEFSNSDFNIYEPEFTRIGNSLEVQLSIKNAEDTLRPVMVIFASYEGETLKDAVVKHSDLRDYSTSFSATLPVDQANRVKVFVWDETKELQPLKETSVWNK